jgi:transcriptional regulator with PAS, ATPase and Fis domain
MARDADLVEIKIGKDVEMALKKYGWPGNVRELSNVLERAMSAIEGDMICLQDLPFYLQRSRRSSPDGNLPSLKDVQARTEKEAIRYALKESNYNKARAARELGIHRTLLYKKMKKYRISLAPDR